MFAGAALGGSTGAVIGGELGAGGGTLVAPGVGTLAGGSAGAFTGAITGAITGASAALARDLSVMYSKRIDGGTPSQAQRKIERGQGPRDIERIDGPRGQPNAQWHAHDKNGGALNLDGTERHSGFDIAKKSLDWLRAHGWKI